MEPSATQNCLFCSRYLECNNTSKGMKFVCDDFTVEQVETPIHARPRKEIIKHTPKDDKGLTDSDDWSDDDSNLYRDRMREILEEQKTNPLPVDINVDDRDFPMAKNFLDFVTNPYISGLDGAVPYARQIQVGVHLFSEWCTRCTPKEFVIHDPFPTLEVPVNWTPDEFRDRIQMLELGVCPKCGTTKSQQELDGSLPTHTALNGIAGQRSGKSFVFALLASYLTHGMMKLQNPAIIYRQAPTTLFLGRVTATEKSQAIQTIWTPLREQMLASPWFQGYFDLLKYQEKKVGRSLINIKDTFFDIRGRNLLLSVVAPSMKTLRGGTSYFAGVDELGLFDSGENNKKVNDNADEVYRSLSNSMRTVRTGYSEMIKNGNFNYMISPFMGSISSPKDKNDKVMRLKEDAKLDKSLYCFHYPTWEFNPFQTRESLESEFITNYITAQRDFGAVPPNSAYPFITDIELLRPCIDSGIQNRWAIKRKEVTLPSGQSQLSGELVKRCPKDSNKRIMALDAGRSDNSYSLCLGYYDVPRGRPVIDGVLELIPRNGKILNLHLLYEDIIKPLIKEANVQLFAVDRWQSFQLVDMIIKDDRIEAKNFSVKYRDFATLKELVHAGGISFPEPEMPFEKTADTGLADYRDTFEGKPVAHLLNQFMTVQDTGNRVDKGNRKTDDTFRALTLLTHYLVHPSFREFCQGVSAPVENKRKNRELSIAIAGLSDSGGGSGGGGAGGSAPGIAVASRSAT